MSLHSKTIVRQYSSLLQIDFGRTVEVTSVATQGHPREEKWIQRYILRYSLGKNWFTYQASGRDKVIQHLLCLLCFAAKFFLEDDILQYVEVFMRSYIIRMKYF